MHRGDIVRVENYFFQNTGETRDKYFIVLSDGNKHLDIVFVFTTSKVREYSHISDDEKVFISAGSVACLGEDTLIVVNNIHRIERQIIARYTSENFGHIGHALFDEVIDKIQRHPRIKPYIKKMIK